MVLLPPKPTILLIPGGWSKARTFEPVAADLRLHGYDARTVTLPSAGGPRSSTVMDDVSFIQQNYLNDLVDQGKEIVIVMHSYSGIPGTQCAQGFTRKEIQAEGKNGGVVGLVYIAAYLLKTGETVESTLPGGLESHLRIEGDVAYLKEKQKASFMRSIVDHQQYADALTYHSVASLRTPLTYEAYRDVNATYLLCENDECIPREVQLKMAQTISATRIYNCPDGHFPMLSIPGGVSWIIRDSITKNMTQYSTAASEYPFIGDLKLDDEEEGEAAQPARAPDQMSNLEQARYLARNLGPGLRWLLY